jgi:hypothetical protein
MLISNVDFWEMSGWLYIKFQKEVKFTQPKFHTILHHISFQKQKVSISSATNDSTVLFSLYQKTKSTTSELSDVKNSNEKLTIKFEARPMTLM